MFRKPKLILLLATFSAFAGGANPAFASSALSIAPTGSGQYLLSGSEIAGAAGIDVEITYDRSTLSNPRITQGSLIRGSMTAANIDVPGVMRFSVIGTAPISGSGPIVTIAFDRTGDLPGKINSINGRVVNAAGKSIPVRFNVQNQLVTGSSTPDAGNDQTAMQGPSLPQGGSFQPSQPPVQQDARYPFVAGGTLTLPQDEIKAKASEPAPPPVAEEPKKEQPRPVAYPSAEPARPEPATAKEEVTSPKRYQAVLELFKNFNAEPSIQAFTALFAKQENSFSQDPPIGIADGKSTVSVMLANVSGETAPNFAFTSARAVSVKKTGDVWIVVAEPNRGALNASVTVLSGGHMDEYPLAISPYADVDLDRSGVVTEADYMLYLKERRAATGLKFDLNRDGRRDYIDDYIFVANYLVSKTKSSDKSVAQQKPTK